MRPGAATVSACYNGIMKFTVLGSGTSHGVPMIGCDCRVCRSDNPRDRHNRSCLLVTTDDGSNIIVDTPPEFRLMAIKYDVRRVDAVLFTHCHADHIFGLDDIRIYNWRQRTAIPLLGEQECLDVIASAYRYCFVETQKGGGKPQLDLTPVQAGVPFHLHGVTIRPLRVLHGRLPIVGYKFGQKAAFVTDVSEIPEETWPHLYNLDCLFLDATRRLPHETHFHLEKSLEVVAELKPRQAYFIHLAHDYFYEEDNASLPAGVALAYDGLEVRV